MEIHQVLQERPQQVLKYDIKGAFTNADDVLAISDLRRATGRPDIAAALSAYYRKQHPRFPGLVEGVCISPLLLAVTLSTHVMPYVVPYVRKSILWVDDGFAIERDPGLMRAYHEILEERLDGIGLRLHPKKTQLHIYTPGTYSDFDGLGFAFGPRGPVPGHEKRQLLIEILVFISEHEDDEEVMVTFMRKAVTNFRDHFALVDDPILGELDADIDDRFAGLQLPRISKGSALRPAHDEALRCQYGEYPKDDVWQEPSLRRYLQRKFREQWEQERREMSPLPEGVSSLSSSEGQPSHVGGAEARRGLGSPGRKGRARHGRAWIPPGSPSLRGFDLYLPSYQSRAPLSDGFLEAYSRVSGWNYLEVGEYLAMLKDTLDEAQFRQQCAELGMYYERAEQIAAAFQLLDHRLRHERKPSAHVLEAIATRINYETPRRDEILDHLITLWSSKHRGRPVLDALERLMTNPRPMASLPTASTNHDEQ